MAVTNRDRVTKALDLLKEGLGPFVVREFEARFKGTATAEARRYVGDDRATQRKTLPEWDAAAYLKVMSGAWNDVFDKQLGRAGRTLVHELLDVRNNWAHQHPFSSDDTDRALDSVARFLTAVSAPQADEVARMKMELRRLVFDEQVRGEKKKLGGSLVEAAASGALKSWRDVVVPHPDVAKGTYENAEFAADLWQIHLGEGPAEYQDPREFFRRTFLTGSLRRLLVAGAQRVAGKGGDPVVQLQTNFGGGKTHSMMALYHLFSGVPPAELPGVDTVLAEANVGKLPPKVRRVVLVGNKISPGNPSTKADGTVVRTIWGELAWQLGGKLAFAKVAADDEKATSPGDALRLLFKEHGPCLVLIDEWVAYARQLHDQSDLPGGGFETQFSFAQALTESAKLAGNCMLVISLPASDDGGSPHAQVEDIEVGGVRGREALDRLRNVVGRLESSWRPASAEEGFEIVRRRLFEALSGDAHKHRDVTARAFADFYREHKAEFPPDCRDADYERRLQAAYPIHPEVFDQLYGTWSTLLKFQRTRGVLRLMAAVIHSLWAKGDKNPVILPSSLPIDDPRVQFELTRYLSENWAPILEKDVDGPASLPVRIDGEKPNLGRLSAARRVARTIFLGSAPSAGTANRGVEDRRIKLGCTMPGESPAVFGDALRHLAGAATYLYQDGNRFWYATKATVTKVAEDRIQQLQRAPDKIATELERRLRAEFRRMGDFSRVHLMPASGGDVPDDLEARLVVLPEDCAYAKEPTNAAEKMARAILEMRGNAPRLYRNTLVFLAADRLRLQDLQQALRRYVAWDSIVADKEALNLDSQQTKQAEAQQQVADATVDAQIPETWQWLLVPEQKDPQVQVVWEPLKLSGLNGLAERAGKKLRGGDLLVEKLAGSILRKHLDAALWRGQPHVAVRQLVEDFARFLYLPRLLGPTVLARAVADGVGMLTWPNDAFAYAESFDESARRYVGLQAGRNISVAEDDAGCVVRSEVAQQQLAAETGSRDQPSGGAPAPDRPSPGDGARVLADAPVTKVVRRFHGSVALDAARVGRDAARIADEVVSHLAGLVGARVRVTLEIDAEFADGVADQVIRTVTENSRTLKFSSSGFEET